MTRIIKPKSKEKTEKIKLELSVTVLEDLKQYQAYIGEQDTDYVIQEAIKQILEAKEFRDWKKNGSKNDTLESEKITE